MSKTVKVELGDRSYSIEIGSELLSRLGSFCESLGFGKNSLIISDSNVFPLYGGRVSQSLADAGFTVSEAVVPAGEPSKSEQRLFELYGQALSYGLDRHSFIVALGGGMVGDLAGYVAASYLRGIRFVQVPTSLLAMVDSSVGGKTGINLPQGKNLIGAFHQPVLVLADMATLKTLPKREYVSGLAEVVKYGIIRDVKLFSMLEAERPSVVRGDAERMVWVTARCCEIKAEVVEQDERESGLRAILNFGHTIGHAIENAAGYGKYLHGEAISVGMVYAARVSGKMQGLTGQDCVRIEQLLRAMGLPVSAPECAWANLRQAMGVDKKTVGHSVRFVLADRIGHAVTGCEVPEDVLEETWKEMPASR